MSSYIDLKELVADPNSPDSTHGRLYNKDGELVWQRKTGAISEITLTDDSTRYGFVNAFSGTISQVGNYAVASVSTNGSASITFQIPHNWVSWNTLELLLHPSPAAAGTGKDIDLSLSWAGVGEARNINTGSDTTSLYNLAVADQIYAIDLTTVLNGSIDPRDLVGLKITHNGVGGTINYHGIYMNWNII
jgi:hypothetical protein